nr:transposon protein, putative, CACTA, En/Spm sub-class [Triticum aestivum]
MFDMIRGPDDDQNEEDYDGSEFLNNTGEGDMIFDRDDRIDEVMNYDCDDDEEHVDPETTKTGEDKFHKLGPGGYAVAMPKWDKSEKEKEDAGVTPVTKSWPPRCRTWFYAHGGELDPKTGNVSTKASLKGVDDAILVAIEEARSGVFQPNRENDDLTRALGNPEHPRRTRGKGAIPWYEGFSDWNNDYRTRARKKIAEEKKRKMEEEQRKRDYERLQGLEASQEELLQQLANDPALDSTAPSMPRSSVGSTPDDAMLGRYPVDDITENTSCVLHVKMKNISMKVADAVAFTNPPEATFHCNPILAGYARVLVDEVVDPYSKLELDIPGADSSSKSATESAVSRSCKSTKSGKVSGHSSSKSGKVSGHSSSPKSTTASDVHSGTTSGHSSSKSGTASGGHSSSSNSAPSAVSAASAIAEETPHSYVYVPEVGNVVITEDHIMQAEVLKITVGQLLEIEPMHVLREDEIKRKYVRGQPLVEPDKVKNLPTRMYELHQWYMNITKISDRLSLMVNVKEGHYYHEKAVSIEYSELFQLYNQDALDKSIVSCYCLMKMYEMRKGGRYGIGFIDPNTVNEYIWKIDARHQKAIEDSMLEFLKRLKYNEDILLPYNFQFHWVLCIIKVDTGTVEILDSLLKEKTNYNVLFGIVNRAWARFISVTEGEWKEKLKRGRPKALKQAQGIDLCAFCVCENIRMMASKRSRSQRQEWFRGVRAKLLETERVEALQEEIAGFLLNQVINPKGEYYYPLPAP